MGSSVERIDRTYGHMLRRQRGVPARPARHVRHGRVRTCGTFGPL